MTSRKLASAAAAASLAGVAVLGLASPASAQYSFPPSTGASVSDGTAVRGQAITVNSGNAAFNPGSTVNVSIPCTGQTGTAVANTSGAASFTFTVPAGAASGSCEAVFSGTRLTAANSVSVRFTIVASAAAAPGQGQGATGQSSATRGASLPRTGSDQMVPLAITGIALVGVGAGILVASRRRREDLPGGIA